MKMVIADDEMIERKAMKKFLEEKFPEIEAAGEASNGRRAIELADELLPDMMIMDINMPGINGLEAIKTIRRRHPSIKFILVSAYDSFEYAKEAMKEGVKEYILKPSAKEETIEAVTRVWKEIKEEKSEKKRNDDSLHIMAKENFLLKLLQNQGNEGLIRMQKQLYPKMKSGYFMVIEGAFVPQLEEIELFLKQHSPFSFLITTQQPHMIVFLVSETRNLKPAALNLARKLTYAYEGRIWAGIGNAYPSLKDFYKSYQEALQALRILRKDKQAHYGFLSAEKDSKVMDEDELRQHLLMGDFASSWQIIQQYLYEMNKIHQLELSIKIRGWLETEGIEMGDLHVPTNLSEWKHFIQYSCLCIQQVLEAYAPIKRAQGYIQSHYHEGITLEQVADYVELSPTYFTKLFKEMTGKTFIDYVTDIRLSRAKTLLRRNRYSLKEISFMVGYKDPNYFSRVFKKQFKLSPRQFQKEILKK
ncbi:response regulator [Bacillus songklensis]|uniref:Response regulator n=1 Tax=Bacillus songklensis TaxID=1069116 RepID=A0ABV8B2Z7_9BACI